MSVHAIHDGIQYELQQVGQEEWRWSFNPPTGPERSGRVVGEVEWAMVAARRAIEDWHEVHEPSEAA
jgi:hypothetical protein